ncbi:MAG: hypothetical protein JRG83_08110 [Deltaproteobacteria bacterium]|nr:hypothetical protein [Deltaproteobacteria bacterium]
MIQRIVLRLQMGSDRMAATDDPVFLGLRGPVGREFRVALGKGKTFRRKGEERYVFGAAGDAEANVANPALNDPTTPALDASQVTGLYLRKRQEPIPNVRGHGELDDRLQLEAINVEVVSQSGTRRFHREGPIWLGLTCGLSIDLARADGD